MKKELFMKRKVMAAALSGVMVFSMVPVMEAEAKEKPALSVESIVMVTGDTAKLKVVNNGNKVKSVTWKSLNKKIATVSKKGLVTGVSVGETHVKAVVKVKRGKKVKSFKLKCSVSVLSDEEQTFPIDGGWTTAQSPEITDDVKAAVTKATETLVGATYEPIALLATQIVAGTNYRILCTVKPVVQNPKPVYAIVTIYADLEGKAEITDIKTTEVEPLMTEGTSGGFTQKVPASLTETEKADFEKAFNGLVGVNYKPVGVIATQTVAGENICYISESTGVYPGAETTYSIVVVYKALDGKVTLSELYPIQTL
ncbi:MAG: Ig-like domain-containing protein [Eubacterium sp.]|nr:Ig-like domain-containing protein [Eubacterium sp.]